MDHCRASGHNSAEAQAPFSVPAQALILSLALVATTSTKLPSMDTQQPTWQRKAAIKRAQLAASLPSASRLPPNLLPAALPPDASVLNLPATSGLLTARQLTITNSTDITATLSKLASGEWSATEVCEAFSLRTAIAQQVTGCLTEFLGEKATKRARELDEHLKVNGEVVGPLHG